jgi:hypothetical protein
MVIKKSIYSTHPSIAHWHAMLQSLPDRTGKTMEEWLALLHKSGLESVSERRKWLKEEHGLGLSTIGLILDEDEHKSPLPYLKPETLVDQIFSGAKAKLRPLYEEILLCGLGLGADVRVCPCATIVPFYREHVFAQVKAPNRAAIHLGLALGDLAAEGILVSTGGYAKKDRITHRLEIALGSSLTKDQKHWFRRAYERAKPAKG